MFASPPTPRPHAAAECSVCLQAGVYQALDDQEAPKRHADEDGDHYEEEEEYEDEEDYEDYASDEDRDGDEREEPEGHRLNDLTPESDPEVISCRDDEEDEEHLSDTLELNAVMDQGSDEMEITVDSGAGASVINPRDLPGVPLVPSAGSQRGQRYVGPGGEVIANLGQMEPSFKLPNGVMGKIVFQGAEVRKPLLAVSDVNKKGNLVMFDGSQSFIIPSGAPELAELRALVGKIRGKVPLHARNGVYTMKVQRAPARQAGFARPGAKA